MKHVTRWAWTVVLGTALCLSWWSLFVLAHRYGMPTVVAGMVSLAIDGVALVLADLAMQRAMMADSAAVVKLCTMGAVALSAWLNFEHAVLWGFPLPIRVLFAAPSVLSGIVFELKLRNLHRARLHELGQVAPSLPRLGFIVWALHPFAALRKVSQIAGSRVRSVPVTVMDWKGVPSPVRELATVSCEVMDNPVILAAPLEAADDELGQAEAAVSDDKSTQEDAAEAVRTPVKAGRSPLPDELFVDGLRRLVEENEGVMPSIREVARRLSIGQDRARRLIAALTNEHASDAALPGLWTDAP